MKKKTVVKLLVILIVLALGWLIFVRPKNYTKAVRKVSAEQKVVTRSVSSSGEIESVDQGDLAFGTTGKITSITVKEGDKVRKWQTLAVLDSSASYQTAEALDQAVQYAKRDRDLYLVDVPAKEKAAGGRKSYELHLRQLNEKISQAEASYQAQLNAMNSYYISAPFEGTVLDVTKTTGEVATVGEVVVKIGNLDKFEFKISVDQEDFGLIKTGMPVEIKLDSYTGFSYKGVVGNLPYFAQADTSNFEIKIALTPDLEHPIKLGMQGDAYVTLQSTNTEVSALTTDDIFYNEDNKPYIWTLENNMLKKKYIEIGIEGDVYVEVKSELPSPILVPATDKDILVEGFKAQIIN